MNKNERLKRIKEILPKVKEILSNIYRDRLVNILLFGSFAKNSFKEESDIDIALILNGEVNRIKEISKINDALCDLMLETGELICVYPVSEEEYQSSIWPLYFHTKTEGIKI